LRWFLARQARFTIEHYGKTCLAFTLPRSLTICCSKFLSVL
jgi:hypothetical protein